MAKLEVTDEINRQVGEIVDEFVAELIAPSVTAEDRSIAVAASISIAVAAGKTQNFSVDEIVELVRDFWPKVEVYRRKPGEVPS